MARRALSTDFGPRVFSRPGGVGDEAMLMNEFSPRKDRRAAILQSCYIPWKGYFDIIAKVDVFVVYDDVKYSKNHWHNRNLIKTQHGLKWLTVPISRRTQALARHRPVLCEGAVFREI